MDNLLDHIKKLYGEMSIIGLFKARPEIRN